MRFTKDADAAVQTDLGEEEQVIALLEPHYELRAQNSLELARVSRVLLLKPRGTEIGLDISLAASGFEASAIERATSFAFSDAFVFKTCSAEDLVIYKAIANREIDWHDVRGILIRQQGRLDCGLIERELRPLVDLKEDPDIWPRWETLRDRYRAAD